MTIGFLGAYVAHEAADRFGSDPGQRTIAGVLGPVDFDGYCRHGDSGLRAVSLTDSPGGWRCSGIVNGIFGTDEIDVDAVCAWQYGVAAVALLDDAERGDGWLCVDGT